MKLALIAGAILSGIGFAFAGTFTALQLGNPAISAGAIPTIVAGPNQPGNTTTAMSGGQPWSTWAPVTVPGQQGSAGTGFADNVVGMWDDNPLAMQIGTANHCVIGFHPSETSLANPLAKVAFWLDGGSEVDVTSSNFTHFGAAEYCVKVADSALVDGPHEMRACLYPVRGYPRCLQAVHAVTTSAAGITDQAHGLSAMKIVTVMASTDANFTVGSMFCVAYSASGFDGGKYLLAAWTPSGTGYPAHGQANGTCAASATTPAGAGHSVTLALTNAGLNEALPKNSDSLFFFTNANGTALPATSTFYVSQPSGGSDTNPCSLASPCATINGVQTAAKPSGDASNCSFSSASANFTGCGSWPVNQAVTLSSVSGTLHNFTAGRPYWVKSSSAGTITLCLEPGCPTAQATNSGDSGTVVVSTDYSHFSIALLCPSRCASPSAYHMPTSGGNPLFKNLFGWVNVIPASGVSHSNTIFDNANGTTGTPQYIANKTHWQVDLKSTKQYFVDWDMFDDVGFNGINVTASCLACTNSASDYLLANSNTMRMQGWAIVDGITTTALPMPTGVHATLGATTLRGNILQQGFLGAAISMRFGNSETDNASDTLVAMPLQVANAGAATFNFGTYPVPAAMTGDTLSTWAIHSKSGVPASGCLSGGDAVTHAVSSYTTGPTTITVGTPGSIGSCLTSDFIPLEGVNYHIHVALTSMASTSGLGALYPVEQPVNLLTAYDVCNSCGGLGTFIQTQGAGNSDPAAAVDLAYVGNAWHQLQPVTCTTGNYRNCLWTSRVFDLSSAEINALYDGNTFDNNSSAGIIEYHGQGTIVYNDVLFQNNTCLSSSANMMTAHLAGVPGITLSGNTGC